MRLIDGSQSVQNSIGQVRTVSANWFALCLLAGTFFTAAHAQVDNSSPQAEAAKTNPAPQQTDSPLIRYEPLAASVSAIPLTYIKPWLHNAQVVDPAPLQHVPYVLASKKGNIITGTGSKIYARGPQLIVGEDYGIYRVGQIYRDPNTATILGQEVFQIATGLVTASGRNGVTSIELRDSFRQEVREGDRVFIEMDQALPPIFYPKAGKVKRKGEIIRVMGSLGNASKDSIVAVNIGLADGAAPGDVFAVYRKGKLVRDPKSGGEPVRLPDERSGMMMLYKIFNHVSYAYIIDSDIPLDVGDLLVPPQGM